MLKGYVPPGGDDLNKKRWAKRWKEEGEKGAKRPLKDRAAQGCEMEKEITRRLFLRGSLSAAAAFCLGCEVRNAEAASWPREARFYDKRTEGRVNCRLCFRKCLIRLGRRGFCRNRENRDGILYSLIYGRRAALQLDPIEK